jgi:hypothetical protein
VPFPDDVAQALLPWLLRATEVAARTIASTFGARDPKWERVIQFLLFVLVACPLILLALAAFVWMAVTLAHTIAASI